jgi:ankyrin repeat protein
MSAPRPSSSPQTRLCEARRVIDAERQLALGASLQRDHPAMPGWTPLHCFVSRRSLALTRWAIQNGADVHALNGHARETPLMLASTHAIARGLVEAGARVDAHDLMGFQPLHGAVIKGNMRLARYLLEQGADIRAGNMHGEQPLHLCKSRRMAMFLLANGASLKALTRHGESPCAYPSLFRFAGELRTLANRCPSEIYS